uniref:Meiosis regulator and mRNA stability factor 1 n=2 Tax=Octopus bimaculoides TaxID=37653 RepID=A0A0L8H2U4_OCTBM|eukprot:XP_014775958.1 PREDICTED: meiosis arrest female protein 1-like isoform X2 [Octopus bimaculoides]
MNDLQNFYKDFSCEYSFILPPISPSLDMPSISDSKISGSNSNSNFDDGTFYHNPDSNLPESSHKNHINAVKESVKSSYKTNIDKDNFSNIFKQNSIQKELIEEVSSPSLQPGLLENPRSNTCDPLNNFRNQSEKYSATHSLYTHQNPLKNSFHPVKARTPNSQIPNTNPVLWSDSEKCTVLDSVEVLVSNLDYNISPREWKEILSSTFRAAVMKNYKVIDVTVKAQSDNSNLAIVRVPTTDDARFAISQFHGKKIGYKRVHVCLKSEGNLNQSSIRSEAIAILKEAKGHVLPLFKFIEHFDRRHHRSITVSELYKMKGILEIREQGGAGRMVHLTASFIASQKEDTKIQDSLESSICPIHCIGSMTEIVQTLSSNFLPNVKIRRTDLASQLKILLEKHRGSIPLMSFPVCYSLEIHPLEIFNNDGVNLEHLISTIPGIKISSGKLGVKKIQYAESKSNQFVLSSHSSNTNDTAEWTYTPPNNSSFTQQLNQISREVVDLLKHAPNCQIPFSKFIPEYHHHFGRQCRVADYGYTKLVELLEAIPHVVQILGNGEKRVLTLSHKAQIRRFTADLLKVLKLQSNKEISLSEFPSAYERILEKPWNVKEYGVCYIEDLLSDVPPATLLVNEDSDPILSAPKRNQTAAEIARTKQFSREVVDIIRHNPHCEMTFNKFIPSYHHHFGRQCKVADYGVVKLLELFECIPHVVQIEEREERMLILTKPEKLRIFADQITSLLRSSPDQRMSLFDVEVSYNCLFECPFDLDTQTQQELLAMLKPLFQVEMQDRQTFLTIKSSQTFCPPLAEKIISIINEYSPDTFSLALKDVCSYYKEIFHETLDCSLLTDLIYYVQVIGEKESAVVMLSPLQEFSQLLKPILKNHNLSLSDFESAFHDLYGTEIKPALYNFQSVIDMLSSIPNVVNLKKIENKYYPTLNENLKGSKDILAQTERENKAESSKESETSKKPLVLTTKRDDESNSWLNLTGVNQYSYTSVSSGSLNQFVMRESCINNDQQALLHQDHSTDVKSWSNAEDFFIESQIGISLNKLGNHSFNGWSHTFHYTNENPNVYYEQSNIYPSVSNLINPVIFNYDGEPNKSLYH